jgi:hypothetical protein
MPPWFMEPGHLALTHERRLTKDEIDTLVSWADNGAPEGDAKDKPAPAKFAEGCSIGTPDMIVEFPHEISILASGGLDQSNLLVKVDSRGISGSKGRKFVRVNQKRYTT